MAQATVTVRHNKDGTVTVRIGRAVEHFDATTKTKGELFDAVKMAVVSKGVRISDITLIEMLQKG